MSRRGIAWSRTLASLAAAAGMVSALGMPTSALDATSTGRPSPAVDTVSIVVIGDSIPYNADQDCPGCTSFSRAFGDAIEAATGSHVALANMSRHDGATTADIAEQLDGGGLDSLIGDADVVIISIGFNDQPPYWGPDRPCVAPALDTNDQAIQAVVETSPACVDEATAQTRTTAAAVLGQVRGLAPDARIAVLTAYNAWTGWSELDAKGPATAAAVSDVIVHALEAWRTALCAEADAVDAVCVDLFAAFNGPDGRTPAGDLVAADYTHPSQAGNDLIRDLLLASGLYPLPGASPGS